MLTRPQIILLKRAQAQAHIDDAEYRETLLRVAGCRSSKAPEIGDDHLDVIMSYFETIYWRGVSAGTLQPPCKPDAPFRQPRFWADKNTALSTSRDRYTRSSLADEIVDLECKLTSTGKHSAYLAAIRARVTRGASDPASLRAYRAALRRTLAAAQSA